MIHLAAPPGSSPPSRSDIHLLLSPSSSSGGSLDSDSHPMVPVLTPPASLVRFLLREGSRGSSHADKLPPLLPPLLFLVTVVLDPRAWGNADQVLVVEPSINSKASLSPCVGAFCLLLSCVLSEDGKSHETKECCSTSFFVVIAASRWPKASVGAVDPKIVPSVVMSSSVEEYPSSCGIERLPELQLLVSVDCFAIGYWVWGGGCCGRGLCCCELVLVCPFVTSIGQNSSSSLSEAYSNQ